MDKPNEKSSEGPSADEPSHRSGALRWWAWGWATIGTLALSFVGSVVAVVLAVFLIRRGNRRQGAAVILVSLAIAAAAFAVFLETSNDGSNGSNGESQISAKEAEKALRQFQRAQAGQRALRQLRQLEAGGSGAHSTQRKAIDLLASWTRELVPALYALKRRADLDRAGKFDSALAAGRRAERRIEPMLHFGGDARKSFLSSAQTPLVEAMVATGDAWTKWALSVERLLPSGGDFADGQRIADLSVAAIKSQRRAYRLAGAEIPAVWRTG